MRCGMELSGNDKHIFDAMNEGILVVDASGAIVFANRAYRRFLERENGGRPENLEGMPLRRLRPGTRLLEVLETGKAILQAPRQEDKDVYFVNMYPVYGDDGSLLGGVSVVTFMQEASAFRELVQTIQQRSEQMLKRAFRAEKTFDAIIAIDEKSAACRNLAQRVAGSNAPVLLSGESGTGKSLYAQAIHNASARRDRIFASFSCSAFDAETVEGELFGYTEGYYTGARAGGKVGLIEMADGGTLVLDDITALKPEMQARLLRVLEEHAVRPLGGSEEIPADVRIIAVTAENLEKAVQEGTFRRDLYYHLNTFHIQIPPLRERMADLPGLARMILGELSGNRVSLGKDALRRLNAYDWPGNVRELRNVLEFASYLAHDSVIEGNDLPANIGVYEQRSKTTLAERIRAAEQAEIRRALQYYGDDLKGKKEAAAELGISLATLYSKLKDNSR